MSGAWVMLPYVPSAAPAVLILPSSSFTVNCVAIFTKSSQVVGGSSPAAEKS
jgi:hypothetical protein